MYCKRVRDTLCMVSKVFPKRWNCVIDKLQSKRFAWAGWIVCLCSLTLRVLGLESVWSAILLWRSHLSCCYLTTSQISALWLLEVSVKPRVKNVIYRESRGYISMSVGGL